MVHGDEGMRGPRPGQPRTGGIPGDETIPPPGRFEHPDDRGEPPTVQLPPPVFCSACGTPNRPSRPRCDQCGEPLHPPGIKRKPRRSKLSTVVLALVALALLATVASFVVRSRGVNDVEAPAPPPGTEAGDTPAPSPSPSPTEPEVLTYVVEQGDSLSSIAQRFDTTVEAIVAENGLTDPDVLAIGDELVIPGASPAPTSTATATR